MDMKKVIIGVFVAGLLFVIAAPMVGIDLGGNPPASTGGER